MKRATKHLYVVIDEAHRGTMQSKQSENKVQTIMQKFEALVAETSSTVQKVVVSPADVRDSGLLKDRLILHMPEMAMMADTWIESGKTIDLFQNRNGIENGLFHRFLSVFVYLHFILCAVG